MGGGLDVFDHITAFCQTLYDCSTCRLSFVMLDDSCPQFDFISKSLQARGPWYFTAAHFPNFFGRFLANTSRDCVDVMMEGNYRLDIARGVCKVVLSHCLKLDKFGQDMILFITSRDLVAIPPPHLGVS